MKSNGNSNLSLALAKIIAKRIDEEKKGIACHITVNDFFDNVGIPENERTDFGFACIMKGANKLLDEWGVLVNETI